MMIKHALFSAMALATLTACGVPLSTQSYRYHSQDYRSPLPPARFDAADIGYTYSPQNNASALQQWRTVLNDALNQLQENSAIAPQAIYLEPHYLENAHKVTSDHILREELTKRGFVIAGTKDAPLWLRFEATDLRDYKTHEDITRYNGDERTDLDNFEETYRWRDQDQVKRMLLVLTLYNVQDNPIARSKSVYDTLAYGYDAGDPSLHHHYYKREGTVQ